MAESKRPKGRDLDRYLQQPDNRRIIWVVSPVALSPAVPPAAWLAPPSLARRPARSLADRSARPQARLPV